MAESAKFTVQSPINCQFCTEKTIKYKCIECKHLLCVECNARIHRLESTKGHKIVTIDSFDQEIDFANIKCRKHDGKYCCLFCKICGVLVCPSCIAKGHSRHKMVEIMDSYNAKIELLKSQRDCFQKEKDHLSIKLSSLEDIKLKVSKKFDSVDSTIKEHEKCLKQRLKAYIENLRSGLTETRNQNNNAIEKEISKVQALTNQVCTALNHANIVLELKDATKFFNYADSLMDCKDFSRPESSPFDITVQKFAPGEFTNENVGRLMNYKTLIDMNLKITNQYQTGMTIVSYISPCSDGSMWVGYNLDDMIQRVQTDGRNLEVLTSVDTKVYSMALSTENSLLVCTDGTKIKKIDKETGKMADTVYDLKPFLPTSIYLTNNKKLIVGGFNSNQMRGCVVVMNKKGDHESVFENDESGIPLFRYPRAITRTSNNCIHVADYDSSEGKGRLVVLGEGGKVVNIYTGHYVANKSKPFKPVSVTRTPSDNVVVVGLDTHILHVLDSTGNLQKYFNTKYVGMKRPFSLAFTFTGKLCVGCSKPESSQTKEAKLYIVDKPGCIT